MNQTFVAYIRDNAGNMITFERFACRKAETVKKNMQKLFDNALYRACTRGAAAVDIYATPDGYRREEAPTLSFTFKKGE